MEQRHRGSQRLEAADTPNTILHSVMRFVRNRIISSSYRTTLIFPFYGNVENWDSISRDKEKLLFPVDSKHCICHGAFLDLIVDDGKQLTLVDPSAFLGGWMSPCQSRQPMPEWRAGSAGADMGTENGMCRLPSALSESRSPVFQASLPNES